MASSTSTGGTAGRIIPSILQTPIRFDVFSRSLSGVFGRADDEQLVAPAEKIQPVVATLYPAEAPPAAPQPVAAPLRFDPRTKSLLASLCAGTEPAGGNLELGRALLQCEEAPMTPHELARYRGVVQRVTLVARMIDAIESDPCVPDGFKQVFDRLRFTLIKSALADSNFLVQGSHPLRAIASELAMRAATSRHWDVTVERELATALDHAVRDFDLSAGFVRPIVIRLQPLNLEVIREFMRQLQTERDEREAALRSQEHVDKEIALRLQGAVLDQRLRFIIEDEWKEVLIWRLRRWGLESAEWRLSLAVAEELLRQAPGIQAGAEVPNALLQKIEAGLIEAGRPTETVLAAFEAMRKAEPPPETVATEFARVAMRLSPLSRLMEGNRWFRVFDHGQQKMRWMRTSEYDPSRNTVTFTEMDGGSPLQMHVQQFIEDLKRGLAAPNNPEGDTAELVAELRGQPEAA
jgi:hypothetical protein